MIGLFIFVMLVLYIVSLELEVSELKSQRDTLLGLLRGLNEQPEKELIERWGIDE